MLHYYCLSCGEYGDYENIILTHRTKIFKKEFIKVYNAAVEKVKSDKKIKYIYGIDLINYIADYMCRVYGFEKMSKPEIEVSNKYLDNNKKVMPIPLNEVTETKERYVVDEYYIEKE